MSKKTKTMEEVIAGKIVKVAEHKSLPVAIAKISSDDQQKLKTSIDSLDNLLTELATQQPSCSSSDAATAKRSKGKKFLMDLEEALDGYENSEEIKEYTLNFRSILNVLKVDPTVPNEQRKVLHTDLIKADLKISFWSLLNCFGRGKLYSDLKEQDADTFATQVSTTYNIGPVAASRYIQFYHDILKYPRLIMSGMTFTILVENRTKIECKAANDYSFKALLSGDIYDLKADGEDVDLNKYLFPNGRKKNADVPQSKRKLEEEEKKKSEKKPKVEEERKADAEKNTNPPLTTEVEEEQVGSSVSKGTEVTITDSCSNAAPQ